MAAFKVVINCFKTDTSYLTSEGVLQSHKNWNYCKSSAIYRPLFKKDAEKVNSCKSVENLSVTAASVSFRFELVQPFYK